MSLDRDQFIVMTTIDHSKVETKDDIYKFVNILHQKLDQIIDQLFNDDLIDCNGITSKGYSALEPYRVKRAIFMAAGFGSRLEPVTLDIPKPLLKVNGKRMIDTLLDAVLEAGIDEIYIVRGYMAEKFDELLVKYPMIKFIDNPYYESCNNISSIMCVKEYLKNSYVLESDLVLYNTQLITKYQYSSNFLGAYTDYTDDFCFETENKIITKYKLSGYDCHHMFGISYWDSSDGEKLSYDVEKVFNTSEGKGLYFENVPLDNCKDNYKVEVRECTFDDIIEIDTYEELKQVDKSYA